MKNRISHIIHEEKDISQKIKNHLKGYQDYLLSLKSKGIFICRTYLCIPYACNKY